MDKVIMKELRLLVKLQEKFGDDPSNDSVHQRREDCIDRLVWRIRELEDNARLMSAAPDLLEVLKDLIAMRSKCFILNEGNWWDEKVLKAIAKAEWRSNGH